MRSELAQFFANAFLMEPRALRALAERADRATDAAIAAAEAAYAGRAAPTPTMMGDVAVINCCGPITYRAGWLSYFFGGSSIEDMQAQLRTAVADPAVRLIAFRWDSPGGECSMIPEFADEIFAAREAKPIVSIADTMIASAAYWLAAQTQTIYASVSSMLGSIGVYVQHEDISQMLEHAGVTITQIAHGARKLDLMPYAPLSDEARAMLQAYVDEIGGEFEAAVARGRGVSRKQVLDEFGQGQVFRGKRAIGLGLADKLGTAAQVISKLTKGRATIVPGTAAALVAPAASSSPAPAAAVQPRADTDPDDTDHQPVGDDEGGDEDDDEDGIDPNDDGTCPDGYELDEVDGLCYLVKAKGKKGKGKAETDAPAAAADASLTDEAAIISTLINR